MIMISCSCDVEFDLYSYSFSKYNILLQSSLMIKCNWDVLKIIPMNKIQKCFLHPIDIYLLFYF